MSRSISIIRRRPGVLDIGLRPTPVTVGYGIADFEFSSQYVTGRSSSNAKNSVAPVISGGSSIQTYDLYVASNFSETFNKFLTVRRNGYRSPSFPTVGMYDGQSRNLTRVQLNPNDFTSTFSAMADNKPFWLKAIAKDISGSVVDTSPLTLVTPYITTMDASINISGSVGTDQIDLCLPTMRSREIMVEGSNDLFVAFEPNSPEFRIPGLEVIGGSSLNTWPTFNRLLVRGSSGSTTFYMNSTLLTNAS